jgi:hypothetical protein
MLQLCGLSGMGQTAISAISIRVVVLVVNLVGGKNFFECSPLPCLPRTQKWYQSSFCGTVAGVKPRGRMVHAVMFSPLLFWGMDRGGTWVSNQAGCNSPFCIKVYKVKGYLSYPRRVAIGWGRVVQVFMYSLLRECDDGFMGILPHLQGGNSAFISWLVPCVRMR